MLLMYQVTCFILRFIKQNKRNTTRYLVYYLFDTLRYNGRHTATIINNKICNELYVQLIAAIETKMFMYHINSLTLQDIKNTLYVFTIFVWAFKTIKS